MRKIIGERLEEEREKLGKKKGEMAAIGGVVGSAYTNYLNGERAPDADFLVAIAAAGADVQYILTGVRSNAVEQESATYTVLNKREAALLDNYRNIPDEEGKCCAEKVVLMAAGSATRDETQSGKKAGKGSGN